MNQKLPCENNIKKTHVISARLSPEINEYVENYRRINQLSRADIARDALRLYFAVKQTEHRREDAKTQKRYGLDLKHK